MMVLDFFNLKELSKYCNSNYEITVMIKKGCQQLLDSIVIKNVVEKVVLNVVQKVFLSIHNVVA